MSFIEILVYAALAAGMGALAIIGLVVSVREFFGVSGRRGTRRPGRRDGGD